MTAAATRSPAEVRITRRFRTGRKGVLQAWEAEIGEDWTAVRTEEPGSPWWLHHKATGKDVVLLGSLEDCAKQVASGRAQSGLDLLLAHDRDEHSQRVSRCMACTDEASKKAALVTGSIAQNWRAG